MPKEPEQRLAEAVGLAALLADQVTKHQATQLTFDLTASGEVPFRIMVPDEPLPVVGLATVPELRDARTQDNAGVTGIPERSVD